MERSSCLGLAAASVEIGCFVLAAGLLCLSGRVSVHAEGVEHLDQLDLLDMLGAGRPREAFELAFEHGDELFETVFTTADGVGAHVGNGSRFTRLPRADLSGPGEWATHLPMRITGPNGEACNACHNKPSDDGAGGIEANVVRDPFHTGASASFIERNTPHLFGSGAIQILAEEMSDELEGQRQLLQEAACASGQTQAQRLQAKGVDFGVITAAPINQEPCEVSFDTGELQGVDADLVIRPFRWKGGDLTLRAFVREAANNELGLQAVELVGHGIDGDFDGSSDELTVGDVTALEVYVSAQPRPVTKVELAELNLIEPLPADQIGAILSGEALFIRIGCEECHRDSLKIERPIFHTPSQRLSHRDEIFPGGLAPIDEGLEPGRPVSFDLTHDLPDNIVVTERGDEIHLGAFATDDRGRAVVPLYSDLKRHEMGQELADPIDEIGTGASVWLTQELWGVGSTAPYLHDGRASTLDEAIRAHGGEAAASADAYAELDETARTQLLAFLDNLVLFRLPEEPEEE